LSKLRIIVIAAAGAAVAAAIIAAAAVSFYRAVQFDPAVLSNQASPGRGTVFLDRNGRELRFLPDDRGERARWVALADIPDTVRNAFIAAEDERFYRHHGFDGIAILRALWSNVTKRRVVSGASTISQQVVRLVHDEYGVRGSEFGVNAVSRENTGNQRKRRTYRDKLIEIVRSVKMERALSKDAILEQYLNRVPMGNNLVGVETAAQAYFGTSVKNLTIAEAALLASLPKAPGLLNPYGSQRERLRERRNWVLSRMTAVGACSSEAAAAATQEETRLRKLAFGSTAPHVIDMLLKQGVADGIVRTTIDLDLQKRVQEILASHAERLRYRGASQAAAIVIHNPTMQVLAAAGSLEYSERAGGFNNGVLAQRSAGSTLKPFLYALAMEEGETVTTLLEDTARIYRSREGQYAPLNFDRKEYGPVTMRAALGSSLNLSAVRMLDRLGEDRFYDLLMRLRLINHPERGPEHYGLGMAIGNPEVYPGQLAEAYAALANRGIYRRASYLMPDNRAEGYRNGKGRQQERTYLFLPQTAAIITDILSDPTARMFTFSRNRNMMDVPFPIAIKTGTSTFFRDLWAAGYTRDHTVVVWAGNFDGSPTRNLSGSTAAMPIFSDIISWLYRQGPPTPFRQPRGIKRVVVCGYSGMRPTGHCSQTVRELFIAGTEPQATCTYHTATARRHELAAPYAGWLYDKNRSGSAGRYRLAGFGDDLGRVFQDPRRGVPDIKQDPAVRVRNVSIAKPVEDPPAVLMQSGAGRYTIGASGERPPASSLAPGDREIRILYPLDKDRFVLDRSERVQAIKLQAAVTRPAAYVEWFVNGRLYQRTGPPYQTFWPLERGTFRLTAVTPENVGDAVQVTVE
jgi:penicillin-binding protein 1C